MQEERAQKYAEYAVQLDTDLTSCAEGTFDTALTNALVAIVAGQWEGEGKEKGKGKFLKSARELLTLLEDELDETPGEPGVRIIPDPEPPTGPTEGGLPWPWAEEPQPLPPLDVRIDIATLRDGLDATQEVRHGRGAGRPLESRHVEALLALDDHASLMVLTDWRIDRDEANTGAEDARARARAKRTLERLGKEEAERRAREAIELHPGPHSGDPDALELLECPVCGHEAFTSDGGDELGMGVGHGECLVCHYVRGPRAADAEALVVEWGARWADE